MVRAFFGREESSLLLFLIAVIVIFSLLEPSFLKVTNAVNVIRQVSILAISAFGMTFAIISGGFDLSVGAVSALAGVVGSMVARDLGPGLGIPIGYTAGLLVGVGVGMVNGAIISLLKISPLITTLGTMTIVRGLAYILTGGVSLYGVPEQFQWLGRGYLIQTYLPIPVVVMIMVFVICYILLNRTTFGRYVYAIGGNEEAARLSGVNVRSMKLGIYTLVGVTAALSGVVLAARLGAGQAASNTGFELDVITAVVLGGVSMSGGEGRLEGTLIGVLIIGILANGLIMMDVAPYYQLVVKGFALLFAVGLDILRKRIK
ncbi:MAG: transporter permease [Chloroflexi bacterium]|nr:transporter permease [Chloroflexota bacterium]